MEVHHHPHSSGKKWTHYLWEFLMLFLAVFCGFLAENQREHMIEHKRERRYMQNLLQDLIRDTLYIQKQLVFQQRAVKYADSLVYMMNVPDRTAYLPDMYYYSRILTILNPFLYSNATITQLKSSGSLRLIKDENLADSIVQYDVWTQRILVTDDNIQNLVRDFRSSVGLVFDAVVIRNISNNLAITNDGAGSFVTRPKEVSPLITDDKKTVNQLCMFTNFIAALYQSHFNSLTSQKGRAVRLIGFIKNEYHLK